MVICARLLNHQRLRNRQQQADAPFQFPSTVRRQKGTAWHRNVNRPNSRSRGSRKSTLKTVQAKMVSGLQSLCLSFVYGGLLLLTCSQTVDSELLTSF
ncbi:unnamed protein product [Linum tenue]|uniref:Uncharacterized protein n=1 Tax=Linum tenue TaxID=586396 RepID=A0AAV0NHJ7_9ROSI|nr:unnamed protein product [Linum tenue]